MRVHPLLAIVAFAAGLVACLAFIRRLADRFGWSAEFARKAVHVAAGLGCLSFPWLIGDASWAVWLLAAAATAAAIALRRSPGMRDGIGRPLHAVERRSAGELLFGPAVATVFELADGRAAWFVVPVAILTLADAAGALAGTRWGARRYGAGSGWKSIEGSAAFLLSAIACIALPLFVLGDLPGENVVWISLTLALLATMAEGLSDHGLDNAVLPLGAFFLLDRFAELDDGQLAIRCGTAVVMLVVVTLCGRRSTLDGAALLAAGLLGYGLAALGGWRCLLPVAGVFAAHLWTSWRRRLHGRVRHGVEPIGGIALATLPWVAVRPWLGADAALAGVALASMAWLVQETASTRRFLGASHAAPFGGLVKGLVAGALPGLIWLTDRQLIPLIIAGAAASLAAGGIMWTLQHPRRPSEGRDLWLLKGALALAAALPALMVEGWKR